MRPLVRRYSVEWSHKTALATSRMRHPLVRRAGGRQSHRRSPTGQPRCWQAADGDKGNDMVVWQAAACHHSLGTSSPGPARGSPTASARRSAALARDGRTGSRAAAARCGSPRSPRSPRAGGFPSHTGSFLNARRERDRGGEGELARQIPRRHPRGSSNSASGLPPVSATSRSRTPHPTARRAPPPAARASASPAPRPPAPATSPTREGRPQGAIGRATRGTAAVARKHCP
jgi:hypothetical protein